MIWANAHITDDCVEENQNTAIVKASKGMIFLFFLHQKVL